MSLKERLQTITAKLTKINIYSLTLQFLHDAFNALFGFFNIICRGKYNVRNHTHPKDVNVILIITIPS